MRLRIAIFCAAAIGMAMSFAVPASAASTAQERREACSKEWDAAKAANKVPAGQTWPKFYSECNARLKAADEGSAAGKTASETKASEKKASESKSAAKPAAEESTRQSRMAQCSAEWKTAKEAGKVPAGQTWPKFYSECNARLSGAAPAAAPAAAAAKPSSTKPSSAKPAAAPAAATAEASGKTRQQQCSAEWKAAKEAGKIPAGQTWPKFYSECNARLSGEAPAATTAAKPAAAAAKPAAAAAKPAAAKVEDDEDTGEGVREPTPGQLAARQRMKDCGAEWRATKAAGKIPAGQTWPQYWSACNKRLKAQGH